MSNHSDETRIQTRFNLPDWRDRLLASDLKEREKYAYEITIRWYLGFCKSNQVSASYD